MIQEPQKSLCFSLGSNKHQIQTFSNKADFGRENSKATNLQRKRKPRLTCPFHTLSQQNSAPTGNENQ
ncbi:hypothetical protein FKM99_15875 [Vibrio parahaemolyticus]|nr:hypothetical protein FKM99_15875 [Vibrio parahaemolyticus]